MRTLRHGLIAGVLGYAAIAVFYASFNALTGRPIFATVVALGSAVLDRPRATGFDPASFFVFNGLHLLAFLGIGWISAWLISETERHPSLWYLVFCLGVFVFSHLWAIFYAVALPVSAVVPGWTVLAASLLAVLLMAVYFCYVDPDLRTAVATELE